MSNEIAPRNEGFGRGERIFLVTEALDPTNRNGNEPTALCEEGILAHFVEVGEIIVERERVYGYVLCGPGTIIRNTRIAGKGSVIEVQTIRDKEEIWVDYRKDGSPNGASYKIRGVCHARTKEEFILELTRNGLELYLNALIDLSREAHAREAEAPKGLKQGFVLNESR
jgi:hypothetical protein